MNDPNELASNLILPYQKFRDAIGWNADMNKQFDEHAIASFTKGSENSSYFWNKYADKGKGFMIEFDSEKLGDEMVRQYLFPYYLQDVEYINGQFDLDDFSNSFAYDSETYTIQDCINAYKGYPSDVVPLERLFQHLRLVKDLSRWSMENESRIIIAGRNSSKHLAKTNYGYDLELLPGTIKSIRLGPRASHHTRMRVKQIADSLNIHLNYSCVFSCFSIISNR